MKVKTTKLSICPCGFPILSTTIPLGTEYEIDPDVTVQVDFRCGGCKTWYKVESVYVLARPGTPAGFLPFDIFKDSPLLPVQKS